MTDTDLPRALDSPPKPVANSQSELAAPPRFFGLCLLIGIVLAATASIPVVADEARSTLTFEINDERGRPLPCRVHLADAAGKPQAAPGQPFWKDHFVCPGRAAIPLPRGDYQYEIERGPEHQRLSGSASIRLGRDHTLAANLARFADLARDGWHAGDLHVHRPLDQIELLMRAEDLHVAPVITWWNKRNPWKDEKPPEQLLRQFDGRRFYHVMGGEDERGGGALLYFHLPAPLAIADAEQEYPLSVRFLRAARRDARGREGRTRIDNLWIDIEKPFWWDLPLWLASEEVDSIGIAHNHMWRRGVYPGEAWGRGRDTKRLPDPQGNGHWTQEIYYHALNCGLRLPPSAGSASGVLPNPVGHNRVYVHTGPRLEYDAWWRQLKAGACFVTNGPLLVVTANEKLPGTVFRAPAGEAVTVDVDVSLKSLDRVKKIEIVVDGRVSQSIDLDEGDSHHRRAKLALRHSGWFLVRALAERPDTFCFASTGPFYVEVGGTPRRVQRDSVQFFIDWLAERRKQVETAVRNPLQRQEVAAEYDRAEKHWKGLLAEAAGND